MKKLIVLIMLLALLGCNETKQTSDIKVGQVWKYKSEDPFHPYFYHATVLEVKDNYVFYKHVYDWDDPDTTRTDSGHIRIFRMMDMELVKGAE